MKKVFMGGIYGSGKTSIIHQLLKNNEKIWAFGVGPYMKQLAVEKWIIQTHRAIKDISDEHRAYLYDLAKKKMSQIIASEMYEIFILDAHYSIYQGNEIKKSIDEDVIRKYDTLILIESNPQDIIHRISKDTKERIFEQFTLENVQEHMEVEKNTAKEISTILHKPLVIIQNNVIDVAVTDIWKTIGYK